MTTETSTAETRKPSLSARISRLTLSSSFWSGWLSCCLLVVLALKGMYVYLDGYERRHEPMQNPLVQTTANTRDVSPGDMAKFPQPRLETNEPREINDFRVQEERTLHSYGWVDQQAGVVRIPIAHAMELVTQRGLPTRPQAGVAPPSDVNTGREVANRSDTSRLSAKPE